MKKFLIKLCIWIVAVLAFFMIILQPLQFKFIADKKKVYLEEHHPKKIDILVLGSSRAAHAINPKLFDSSLYVFNMGQDGFGLPSNYLLLKVLIERHHLKVSNLLMQVDESAFNGNAGFSRKFRDDVFIDELGDQEVYNAYKTYRGSTFAYAVKEFPKLSNLIYCDFRKFLKTYPLAFQAYSKGIARTYANSFEEVGESRGYIPYENARIIQEKKDTTSYIIEPDDLDYFIKLANLCKKQNINLILFRSPMLYAGKFYAHPFDQFIDSFTKKNNIPFYDYKSSYQYRQYYYDYGHFTDTIATLLTKDLIKKIGSKLSP